jgi:hypothetical protein
VGTPAIPSKGNRRHPKPIKTSVLITQPKPPCYGIVMSQTCTKLQQRDSTFKADRNNLPRYPKDDSFVIRPAGARR